jgi:hypothetical protein
VTPVPSRCGEASSPKQKGRGSGGEGGWFLLGEGNGRRQSWSTTHFLMEWEVGSRGKKVGCTLCAWEAPCAPPHGVT